MGCHLWGRTESDMTEATQQQQQQQHACVYVCACVCMPMCVHVPMCVPMCVCAYVCECACVCVCETEREKLGVCGSIQDSYGVPQMQKNSRDYCKKGDLRKQVLSFYLNPMPKLSEP